MSRRAKDADLERDSRVNQKLETSKQRSICDSVINDDGDDDDYDDDDDDDDDDDVK